MRGCGFIPKVVLQPFKRSLESRCPVPQRGASAIVKGSDGSGRLGEHQLSMGGQLSGSGDASAPAFSTVYQAGGL